MNLLERINERLLEAYRQISPDQRGGLRLLVGVSGGADSVCLISALKHLQQTEWDNEKKLQIFAVHVNHMIRLTESVRDEVFTVELCESLGIPCFVEHVDIPTFAKEAHLSLEEAGRIKRYEVLEQYRKKCTCDLIAVAHHQDDNVETILLNYLRGSGLKGLCGMQACAMERRILRPLLDCSKADILAYLTEKQIAYVTDSTNLENDATRNRLRNLILPALEKCGFSDVKQHVLTNAAICSEADEYLMLQAKKLLSTETEVKRTPSGALEVMDCGPVYRAHTAVSKYAIRSLIKEVKNQSLKDLTAEHIERILELMQPGMRVGTICHLPAGLRVRRTYKGILLYQEEAKDAVVHTTLVMSQEGMLVEEDHIAEPQELPDYEMVLEEITLARMKELQTMKLPENTCSTYVDYDKIVGGLTVRYRQAGDQIALYKDGKGKSLKDYLIDRKVLKEERDQIPLVVMGRRDVLWIAASGELAEQRVARVAENCKIDEETTHVLWIRLIRR